MGKLLLIGLALIIVFASSTYAATSGTVTATNDARIAEAFSNTNYGAENDLTTQADGNNNWMSFVQFNLPNSSSYNTATFHFYNRLALELNQTYITLYYCDDSFEEMAIKWNNWGSYMDNCDVSPFYNETTGNFSTGQWNSTDITTIVNADADKTFVIKTMLEPQNLTGFLPTDETYVVFQSKESANGAFVNYTLPTSNITFSIKRELNISEYITQTFSIEFINIIDNVTYTATSTSGWVNDTNIQPGTYEIRYFNDNHKIRSRFLSITANSTYYIELYAINTTEDDVLDVVVRDFTLTGLKNTSVVLQRWYTSNSSGFTVGEGVTNSQGKYRFYVDQGDAFYRIIISYGGSVIFTSDWEIIQDDTYRITTDIQELYTKWSGLDGTLIFYNTSIPFYYEVIYANKDADISSVCLEILEVDSSTGAYIMNDTSCLTTNSGSMTTQINETKSYLATLYVVYSDGGVQGLDSHGYIVLTEFEESMREEGLIISLIIVLALVLGALFISEGSPIAAIAAFDVGIIFVKFVGLYALSLWALGIIIPGSFVIMYYLNKKV